MTRRVAPLGTYEIFYTMRSGACGAAAHVLAAPGWRHGAEGRNRPRLTVPTGAGGSPGALESRPKAVGEQEVVPTFSSHE